jgi:hypothetical protein
MASGMTAQLAQPRKGRKAKMARPSATRPIMSETMFNMG